MTPSVRRRAEWLLTRNVPLRVLVYYAVLGAALVLMWRYIPEWRPRAATWLSAPLGGIGARSDTDAEAITSGQLGAMAAYGMVIAVLLAIPVAWIYTLTRQKRGYRQSVVQTLVILPAVVAAIVVMVKYSLALAFSLAGIVAAVRFRTTLDDSKDAVYVFLATGVGFAAGFEPTVAIALSVLFNAVALGLWYYDFGRPVRLEGRDAERRLERLMRMANRTGEFVARLDTQVLAEMAPEQLDALADRAWRRRKRNAPDIPAGTPPPRYGALLRIRTAAPDDGRYELEQIFDVHLKRWRFGGVLRENDGTRVLEYAIQLKRNASLEGLLTALCARGAPHVIDAKVV
ncbi:MAG: DUF4956 domain-containing protein [Gemmatimonadaceae bacterium]